MHLRRSRVDIDPTEYAEALKNYYQALRLELDPYDRSYILYNIGLIHTSNGRHGRALEYYYQALKRNPTLPQALNSATRNQNQWRHWTVN